jgi:aspartate-semialdehyde dehydrogenase
VNGLFFFSAMAVAFPEVSLLIRHSAHERRSSIMESGLRLAIVGVTGEVGKAVLAMIDERELALAEVHALASAASTEETVLYKNRPLLVGDLGEFDFARADVAIFAVPAAVAEAFVPRARKAGCRVIDHSEAFRLEADVPLLVEGMPVPDAGLVACPGALAALLAPVLSSLQDIRSVQVTVLSPVSVAGRAGVRELAGQTGELLNGRGVEPKVFPAQIAFNTLPLAAASSDELMDELEKLLPATFPVAVAEVRVPVFYGMTVSATVQTGSPGKLGALRQALSAAGVKVADTESDQGLVTPVTEATGQDGVFLASLRALPAPLEGVQLWLVGDNIRQGAARHSLYVLEKWIKDFKY